MSNSSDHNEFRRTLAGSFDPRRNSFNFLRVFFALLVIIGHSPHLGFDREPPSLGSLNYRDLAVDGFFVISGFLITRSRFRSASGRDYLRSRFLRIFPGYWLALLVGAAVVGPIAWMHSHRDISGYLSANPSPVSYVVTNITLFVHQYSIGGVFVGQHANGSVNGSLWTLLHEFLVYLLIAGIAALGLLKMHSRVLIALAACYFAGLLWSTLSPDSFVAITHSPQLAPDAMRLGLMFVAGAVLFVWADRIPYSAGLAAAAIALILLSAVLPQWQLLGAFPFAYLVLWLGIRLPLRNVGRRHDLSYGIYLYGWPSQQLLRMWDIPRFGFAVYTLASIALATVVAFVSWNLVESRAMRLKHKTKRETQVPVGAEVGESPPEPPPIAVPHPAFSGEDQKSAWLKALRWAIVRGSLESRSSSRST